MTTTMRMSILSARNARSDVQIKHAGKIRPGIKVLKSEAQNNAKAVQLYNEGVAKRLKFSEIEKAIKDATKIDNPLAPRNTPYFTVAASDFGMPEIASHIVNLYGEVRDGDEVKRLYRFPIVFHTDDLNDIYPNQFKRHGGDRNYESHYGEDGVRYCRFLPEITDQQKTENKISRIKKLPRREMSVRGPCEPGTCFEFQQGQCKFRGRLMFYIPKVPTTGLLVMETSSEYAAEGIWNDLQRIIDVLGSIPRMNPMKPDAPVFYITKVLEPRTYYDERGVKKTCNQWVPRLQADIDIASLLQSAPAHALPAPSTPVGWLAAPKGMPLAAVLPALTAPDSASHAQAQPKAGSQDDPTTVDEQLAQMVEAMGLDDQFVSDYFDIKLGTSWNQVDAQLAKALQMLTDMAKVGNACVVKLIAITVKVNKMGIDMTQFNHYAFRKYGKGYTSKEDVLSRIEAEVDGFSTLQQAEVLAYIADALSPA
jgi:hypothetical protein